MKNLLKIVLVMSVMLLSTNPVFAYTYMGTGYWSSTPVKYAISSDIDSSYINPIKWAADIWTNDSAYELDYVTSGEDIIVCAYNYNDRSWNGLTYVNGIQYPPINTMYSYSTVHLNRRYLDSMSDIQKKLITCHEFGHTASLFHTDDLSTMMYGDGILKAYDKTPSLRYHLSIDDIAGIAGRYG